MPKKVKTTPAPLLFQPFLRFYTTQAATRSAGLAKLAFQPFLRFYKESTSETGAGSQLRLFQPFLRFYRSCVRFLWVFKFFFGFL